MVVYVVVTAVIVVDGLVLDVEQLCLEEVHGPGLVKTLLPLLMSLDLHLPSPLILLFRDDLRRIPLSTEEHLVVLELRLEERDRRGEEVACGAGVIVEALRAADSPPAQLAVDGAFHDLAEFRGVMNLYFHFKSRFGIAEVL